MTEEYQLIMKNDVWDILPKQKNKSVVSLKWIYKIKHVVDGSIQKYKARFVAIGFSQKEGIDYEETFSLVARYTSIRTIMALASMMKWGLHQMDLKTHFLNGVIEEERVYYCEPEQGILLIEDDVEEVEKIPIESLMDCLESKYQHENEASM